MWVYFLENLLPPSLQKLDMFNQIWKNFSFFLAELGKINHI